MISQATFKLQIEMTIYASKLVVASVGAKVFFWIKIILNLSFQIKKQNSLKLKLNGTLKQNISLNN